jgi:hypothetical protein
LLLKRNFAKVEFDDQCVLVGFFMKTMPI